MLVFVSYSRQNSAFVNKLVKDLRRHNVPMWMDQQDIPPGVRWDVAVEEALEKSTHLLLVLSEHSVLSPNVRDEIDFAMDEKKTVLPIVIDECRRPLRVRRMQFTDFRRDYDTALRELLERAFDTEAEPAASTDLKNPFDTPDIIKQAYDEVNKARNTAEMTLMKNPLAPHLDQAPQEEDETVLKPPPMGMELKVSKAINILRNPKSNWYDMLDAALQLGKLLNPDAIPALKSVLDHEEQGVRRAARQALRLIYKAYPDLETQRDTEQMRALDLADNRPKMTVPTQIVKMVITGAYNAGQTTFIRSISEIDINPKSDSASFMIDFGRLTASDDLAVYFFGTPAHKRFDFMWESLAEGMLGFVLVVDSTRPETFAEARNILKAFTAYDGDPYVIAANKQDLPNALHPEQIRELMQLGPDIKILPCQALDEKSVRSVVLELLYTILDEMEGATTPDYHIYNFDDSPMGLPAPKMVLKPVRQFATLTVTRAMPEDAEAIAAFLNANDKKSFSAGDIYRSFGKYGYISAVADGDIVGVGRFWIDNLMTFVQLSISQRVSKDEVGEKILTLIHQSAEALQSEIALVLDFAAVEDLLKSQGYQKIEVRRLSSSQWRVGIKPYNAREIMMLALRAERILKPEDLDKR